MKGQIKRASDRVRLLARYARFFALVGYRWEFLPQGPCHRMGSPSNSVIRKSDRIHFRIIQPCHNSECQGGHVLLVKIDPKVSQNKLDTESLKFWDFIKFGSNPAISIGQWTHGHGGGIYRLSDSLPEVEIRKAWRKAAL
jgi:hypothetical protein